MVRTLLLKYLICYYTESVNIGAIVGGTIGGVIVLIIAIVIVRHVLLQNTMKRQRGDWFAFNTNTTRHSSRPNIIWTAVVTSTTTTTSSQLVSTEPARSGTSTSSVRSPMTWSSGICLHLQSTLESHHLRCSTSSIRHPRQVFLLQWERWKVWSSTSILTTVCRYSWCLSYSTSSLPSSRWICISPSYCGSVPSSWSSTIPSCISWRHSLPTSRWTRAQLGHCSLPSISSTNIIAEEREKESDKNIQYEICNFFLCSDLHYYVYRIISALYNDLFSVRSRSCTGRRTRPVIN